MAEDDETQRRIAERAFQLWEEQGRPEGHDYRNWLQAEAEILGGGGTVPPEQESQGTPAGDNEMAGPGAFAIGAN